MTNLSRESDGDEELNAEGESGEDEGEVEARQQPSRDRGRERGRDRFERRERRDFQANGASRDDGPEAREDAEERISLGVLPPAIGAAEETLEAEAPKPRRRTRKPRPAEGDEEVAPAA